MRKNVWIIVTISLLAGITTLCAVRWKAWFAMPQEPSVSGDTIDYHFYGFGEDSVPGFMSVLDKETGCTYWYDTTVPDTLQIVLFGDIHNDVTRTQLIDIAGRHPATDCYAQLGDFFERMYPYYIQRAYKELKGTRFESLPVMAAPGNHEYIKGIHPRHSPLWTTLFTNPNNGPIGGSRATYWVDFAYLRFIVIDTNDLFHLADYTRINTWVKAAIDSANDKFIVVMMHHPILSSAKGRFNPLIAASLIRAVEGADVVFSGHDHIYSRKMPFIHVNSSSKHYTVKNDSLAQQSFPVYELISVTPNRMHIETHRLDNGVLCDTISLSRLP